MISSENSLTQYTKYEKVFEFLNKRFGSCYSNADYYSRILNWQMLYEGFVKEYHTMTNSNGISTATRNSNVLNMAKRVAEDWTATLMADKPTITVSGKNKSVSRFILGSRGTGGVLGSNNFFNKLADTVEQAFALGTSAIVAGISSSNYVDGQYRIDLNYYSALSIIPISYRNNIIEDCAFISTFNKNGKTYYNMSCHVRDERGLYRIYNFESADDFKFKRQISSPEDGFETGSEKPLFVIIKPQKANNLDLNSPMGVSVYSEAFDIVLTCDFIYDAIHLDVLTAQRIILMDKSLLGRDLTTGEYIPPQDYKKWCMQFFGDEGSGDVEKLLKEFSPKLNAPDLCDTLQQNLNLLSMRCGLGSNYYNFNKATGVTATEYTGSQQDLVRNVKLNSVNLTEKITMLLQQLIWLGINVLDYDLPQDYKIEIVIPDSVVTDDTAEKEQDRIDVRDGLMSRAEYRAKWYGETPEQAEQSILKIDKENRDANYSTGESTTKNAIGFSANNEDTEIV